MGWHGYIETQLVRPYPLSQDAQNSPVGDPRAAMHDPESLF